MPKQNKNEHQCLRCGAVIPQFPALTTEKADSLRRTIDERGRLAAIQELRALTACEMGDAKAWVEHRGVPNGPFHNTSPCPFCGEPLRAMGAKQCRFCRRDWHDPDHPTFLERSKPPDVALSAPPAITQEAAIARAEALVADKRTDLRCGALQSVNHVAAHEATGRNRGHVRGTYYVTFAYAGPKTRRAGAVPGDHDTVILVDDETGACSVMKWL